MLASVLEDRRLYLIRRILVWIGQGDGYFDNFVLEDGVVGKEYRGRRRNEAVLEISHLHMFMGEDVIEQLLFLCLDFFAFPVALHHSELHLQLFVD